MTEEITDLSLGDQVAESYKRAFEDDTIFEQVKAEEIATDQASVVVAFVGAVSAGKSSLIKELFGVDVNESKISPIEGSTDKVLYFKHPEVDNFYIADTPGLADVEHWRSAETYKAMPSIDVVIFVLDRLDDPAIKEHRKIRDDWDKPCLVVRNKMDDIAAQRRPEMLNHVRKHFPGSTVVGCAAGGVPPATARVIEPFGLEQITDWIWKQDLSEAKKTKFTYGLKDKNAAAQKIIKVSTGLAAGVGLIPAPGVDMIPIALIQTSMVRKVNRIYGAHVSDEILRHFIQVLVSQLARGAYRWIIQFGKGAGWFGGPWGAAAVAVVAAVMAGGTTYGLGQGSIAMGKNDLWTTFNTDDEITQEVLIRAKQAYKEYAKKYKPK
jgi:small GTP-binding protein